MLPFPSSGPKAYRIGNALGGYNDAGFGMLMVKMPVRVPSAWAAAAMALTKSQLGPL